MADGVVARLKILLGIDSAEVATGSRKAEREVSKMSKGISGAAKLATAALGAMGAALTVDTIIRVTKQALEYTTAIKSQAREAGVTTRTLQEYRYAALQAGVSNEDLADGFKELTQKIGEAASGGKSAAAVFDDTGIAIRDASGEARNAADILPELADVYSKLGSEAEKSAFASRIFGEDAGPKMKALLEQGSAGMNSYRQAAHELGMVISDTNIKKAEEAEKKMAALNRVLTVKIATFVAENSDAISKLVDKLIDLAEAASDVIRVWGYVGKLDWNPGAATLSDQLMQQRVRDLGPGVELTDSVKSAVAQRKAQAIMGPSGGPLRSPPRSSATKSPAATPWGSLNTNLNRRAISGDSSFGGTDWSRFTPAAAANDWIKAAKPITDIALLTAEVAANNDRAMTSIAAMASVHAPRLREAVAGINAEAEKIRSAAQSILDRLFPDEAELRRYKTDLDTLNAALKTGQISTDDYARSVEALRHEFNGFSDAMRDAIQIVPTGIGPTMEDALDSADASWDRFTKGLVGDARTSRVQVVQTYEQMAQDVLSSLDRLSSGIRGGGFLDILSGVLGIGLSLGKTGLFGKSIQTNLNSTPGGTRIPGFATGGAMILGGRSGIDRNLLSLNGAPLARVSAGERMTISPSNDLAGGRSGGVVVVKVEEGALFRPVVESTAGRVVTDASPAIMEGSAKTTTSRLARRQSRRLSS